MLRFHIRLLIGYLFFAAGCTTSPGTRFIKLPATKTGINFENTVKENDSINPLKMEFLYNGGGIAVGDFNNDGLEDLYFTASTTPNKLYLNNGGLQFKDISAEAGVDGAGHWCNGATVVDINNDGWKDIYVSTSIKRDPQTRRNLLYINKGTSSDGTPVFSELAEAYGLADTSFSVQAAFFDYDRDGDLDMYLATTKPTSRNIYTFGARKDSSRTDYDKLYKNEGNGRAGHPVFVDVSEQAGIFEKGYGLGITIGDLNTDGWPDIYVTNDFIGSDHLYINNRDGTFTNRVEQSLKHTSKNAMGNDITDVNNDGLPDLIAVDMNPEDNFRKQKNMGAANYGKYRNMVDFGYSLQFVRNTLQINQSVINGPDSAAIPVFADIAYYAGVAETDWSWTPSVADFDNDGLRDLLITNGYPKDVTDHDFVSYRQDKGYIVPDDVLLDQIPEIKIANYAFRNTSQLKFEDVSKIWGLNDDSYATGATYVDLDNDGDLDYLVNNINSVAGVYENTTNQTGKTPSNFLRIRFENDSVNRDGIGAKVLVYFNGAPHLFENYPTRGYLSCISQTAHFGLGTASSIDSLKIQWPNGNFQNLGKTAGNQTILLSSKNADAHVTPASADAPLFTQVNKEAKIKFVHTEHDFIDFDHQRLLPHKLSEYGPALASADIDGNGLDDIFVAGPKGKSAVILLQQTDGSFFEKPFQDIQDPLKKPWEETGVLLADFDNDDDPDLYLCSGSTEFPKGDTAYQDRLFVNDGKGNFSKAAAALPPNRESKQVLKAADIDLDGDLDLFIGSRSVPNEFPRPASGFIYRNDTRNGRIQFTDITDQVAPALKQLGLITDALWSDFNGDGKLDLIVCGEFMPVTFFSGSGNKFSAITTGVEKYLGMWNSITAADIDNDGNTDYIVANLGLNSFYKGSTEKPFTIYAADFDNNGSFDAIPFLYLKGKNGSVAQYPAFTRDDMFKQMPRIKGDYPTYHSFAAATLTDIIKEDERSRAIITTANYLQSAVLKNNGKAQFTIMPLPYEAQWSSLFGMLAEDFDGDGFIDLLVNTNDLGIEVNTGQHDALNGLFLKGKGDGSFATVSIARSGFNIPSNGKAIVKFRYRNDYAVAVSQNRGPLEIFRLRSDDTIVSLAEGETKIETHFKNGTMRKEEFYFGNSFLSQSARFVIPGKKCSLVRFFNDNGTIREIKFP